MTSTPMQCVGPAIPGLADSREAHVRRGDREGGLSVQQLRIGILSRHPELYSPQRLRRVAASRGHDARIVNYNRCFMGISSSRPAIVYGGERLALDAALPRIGVSGTAYGTAVVRQLEVLGVAVINGSRAIQQSRDKIRALQILAEEGLPVPATGIAHSTKDIDGLIELVGGPPLVIKILQGTQGAGVVLAETRKAAESVITAFRQLNADILVQEFIAEAEGTDLRCLVVGDRVVAAMMRRAPAGEFRANLHRGGTAEPVELSPEEREAASRAASALELHVAGVDLLRGKDGPLVLEVNSSPGLEGIEKVCDVDVAAEVVSFVECFVARQAPRDRSPQSG